MCHLCYSMHSFRESSTVTQNGYSSHALASSHSDSPLSSNCAKYGYRNGMAVTTDGCAPQSAYHNQGHHNYQTHNGHMHHTAQHHQTHLDHSPLSHSHSIHDSSHHRVWDVWSHNFHEGMQFLRQLARDCRYVAVDTEFPGVVAKVFGEYANSFEQAYHNIKVNIDMMKPIQIGFSFFNERGLTVGPVSTVQFNIKWNVDNDTYADDSIKLLAFSGIDFEKLKRTGIELNDFAEAFIASGLALNESITWIGFHSAYDFAYMMKICTNWMQMPDNFLEFQKYLLLYFPRIVDLKAMMSEHRFPKSGLQELADLMRVPRIGLKHQAGSDAMLTGETFFRFLEEHGGGKFDHRVLNLVYGLNYCPNGVSNTWIRMNTSSPQPDNTPVNRNIICSSNLYRNTVHSADHSGRSSPTDSNSGHKSS
ncbi:CCR4-NOT transcription complex subunit 7 [Paragonimus heterotremus]|uniref:poly(A)-specific ribonuclease n=1 Tax=Paragonimus heterotremus TaxID=100268 RepID=A0A8J4TLG9_9TREM|nr:CCR4-NOT transcription complex subunit 7 [Paragonimus heterotremus]